ncbi:SIR2 family protein [Achromobacter ruhlandii]|uniref:SIR2 family protein n=1 Tax=Achromobacter ruhlandii TaxID=72557 RepID=UPI002DB7C8A4|nr:SIR2 family protein [Achromobacter ruhlandii]MEB6663511.1 SIR2 family protein [Achromobacter ruhlandii]
MDIEQAIHYALDGDAILFTGAGFSWGAMNRLGRPLPFGTALAGMLLSEVGYPGKTSPLDKAAGAYLRRKPDTELVKFLIDQFTAQEVSESHEVIAAIPWRRVYTTNYDTVYELARRSKGHKVMSLDAVDEPNEHLHKGNVIVHINGSVDRVSTNRLNNSFKLTTASYATDAFMTSPWAFHFRADLRTAKAVIFIGYSMYDLDIRRMIYEEDMSERCIFVTGPITPDNELEAEDLSDLGLLAPIGVDAFAQQIRNTLAVHVYREEELLLNAWTELDRPRNVHTAPADQDVHDFLVYGRDSDALIAEACAATAGKYSIPRIQAQKIFQILRNGTGAVVLHGGLGTGKSFIASVAGNLLARAGLPVFRLDGPSDDAMLEAEKILTLPDPKVMIIDGYKRHLDMLRRIVELTGMNCRLLLLERSSSHEIMGDDLDKILKVTPEDIDVDTLSTDELQAAVSLLDQHGLWGERQAWNDRKKFSYLRTDCEAKLPHLLVSILNAVHIKDRYRGILGSTPNERELRVVVISIACLTVLNYAPRTELLQELLGTNVILSKYKRYTELRDIIDISSREIRMKSPVLAQYLLQHVFAAGHVVDVLIILVRMASELRYDSGDFRYIHADLMRYANIAQMLPEKERLRAIIKYYESIKDLPSTKGNPQFWLQYAIGCLTNRNLPRAEIYFKSAYSFARQQEGYDTFQIDNHYARFLLQKALTDQPLLDAMTQVFDARDIVIRQVRAEQKKYPFRIARGLFDVYDALSPRISPDMNNQLRGSLAEIYERASGITGKLKTDRYVMECVQRGKELKLGSA